MDCYFGLDMAIYHTIGPSPAIVSENLPVVPDSLLSLGIDRRKTNRS